MWNLLLGIAGLTTVLLLTFGLPVQSQEKKMHRVVFELTRAGAEHWQALLNNVENLQKALGKENTEIEVVAHGKGLGLLKASGEFKARVVSLAGPQVRFVACENTMRRMKLEKADLLPEAGTVDSGVAEVVRKQEAGWSYIKSGL